MSAHLPTPRPQLDTLSFLVDGRSGADRHDQSLTTALQLFELAETLGYDAGWVRDHPASLAVLAALSQRTGRLDLGVWVSVAARVDGDLPVAHLATVDALSRGRLRVLLGPAAGGSTISHGEGGSARRILLPLDSAGQDAAARYRRLAERPAVQHGAFDVPILVGSSDHLLDVLTEDPLVAAANDLRVDLPADLPAEDLAQVLHDVATFVAPELGWTATSAASSTASSTSSSASSGTSTSPSSSSPSAPAATPFPETAPAERAA